MLTKSHTSLTRDIFDVYASYKRGTAQILRWLSARSDQSGTARPYLTSIGELRQFADNIILRRIEVPDELIRVYRQTIQARKLLASFYRRGQSECDKAANETHDYFNEVFEDVFRDLVQFCTHPPTCTNSVTLRSQDSSICHSASCAESRWSNSFACLEGIDESEGKAKPNATTCTTNLTTNAYNDQSVVSEAEIGQGRESGPAIGNDALDELTCLYTHLLQLDDLMGVVKQSYHRVATGAMPLVVAASTTNAAYGLAKVLCTGLKTYHIYNPAQLKERYLKLSRDLGVQVVACTEGGEKKDPDCTIFMHSIGPQLAWKALCEYRKALTKFSEQHCVCEKCGHPRIASDFPVETSMEVFSPCDPDGHTREGQDDPEDYSRLVALIRGMHQTLKSSQSGEPANGPPFNTPLVKDLLAFLEDSNSDDVHQTSDGGLSFGLHLLLESYKSYCLPAKPSETSNSPDEPPSNTTNLHTRRPRLQSLKFAMSVKTQLNTLIQTQNFPCNCLKVANHVVASLLVGAHALLDTFLATRRFDLFFQAPWVSGHHIVEDLSRASDYGSKAWHYGYFVGTVLHVYNALVLAKRIAPGAIPVLEALCDVFEDAVFLGKRSSHNVLGCWQRWAGGKIGAAAAHRGRSVAADVGITDRKWHLCSVPDESHGGDQGRRSFRPGKVSLFSLLGEVGDVLDDRVVGWVYLPKDRRRKLQPKDTAKARVALQEDGPYTKYLERIQAQLLAEFRGPDMPVARINYLAVYQASIQTMRRISDANHKEDPGYICKCPAEICLRECDALLKRRLVASGKRISVEVEQPACDSCLEHLMAVFGDGVIEDFLWDV